LPGVADDERRLFWQLGTGNLERPSHCLVTSYWLRLPGVANYDVRRLWKEILHLLVLRLDAGEARRAALTIPSNSRGDLPS
jgi:hypothetical protein